MKIIIFINLRIDCNADLWRYEKRLKKKNDKFILNKTGYKKERVKAIHGGVVNEMKKTEYSEANTSRKRGRGKGNNKEYEGEGEREKTDEK